MNNIELKRANVIVGSGSSVDVVWGSIAGDISQQTDLQDELNGIKEQVKEDIANKADRSELANLATKEELSSGLLGKADKENTYTKEEVDDKIAETDLSNYYTKQEIDEKGYITAETDPTVPEWAKQPTKPTYTAEEVGALSADTKIPDISGLATKEEVEIKADKTSIPTKVSQLTNDSNYTTSTDLQAKQDKLVSGTNIKTVNGNSLLGEGNIEIQGGTGGIPDAPADGKKYVRSNNNWVEEVDISDLATKEELASKLDISTYNNDKATFETKENAAATYQPKGDYALKSDLSTLATKEELTSGLSGKADTSAIADMLTKTEASTTYATKAELGDINAILDNINGEVV